jgi:hypothetical protein
VNRISGGVLVGIALLFAREAAAQAQEPAPISTAGAGAVFRQAREICARDGGRLWGRPLCGPIMLVDPRGRRIVANQRDRGGALAPADGLYVGTLPTSENIANTATAWSGLFWTQIIWPLPGDAKSRGLLIAHEMFHRIQPGLGLALRGGGDNAHLDTLDGRYWIQLEWRALAAALRAPDAGTRSRAIEDALLFRAERYRLFPAAAREEQALELNEGLAEYTGVRLGLADPADRRAAALGDLVQHAADASFVRSFAYATGPAYGLLLDRAMPDWRRRIARQPRFDLLLAEGAGIRLPAAPGEQASARAAAYDGPALRIAEAARDERRQRMLADYRAKFVAGPVLVVPLRHMNIQFDPRNLQPLDDKGTIYPNLRLTDDWGVLEAGDGALLSPDWTRVTVAAPAIEGDRISGKGWTLALKPGWKAVPGPRPGDFVLSGPAR